MADIAFILHWPPEKLFEMEWEELMLWHGLAVERWNKVNEVKK
ncbi:MAG: GpE family phage tail protein [Sphingobium sp.]|nr:GpE family phage tail protein [Sphingobium sp.]